MSQNKKVALVTGASRGIGRAIAMQLAADGCLVVGTATTEKGATNITDYLHATGGKGCVLNVNHPEEITALVSAITQDLGAPAVLVNNAAITRDNLALRMKPEEWDAVINTNLNSIFHTCKACIRGMMKAKAGRIINITSVVGVTGNPGQINYSAAKAGMIGFTKSLAAEIASRNISVNAVAPGFIDTDMTKKLTDEQREGILQMVPMQRLGHAQEIADTVSFLASEKAAYITGQTIHVNGGMFMA